MVVLEGGAVSYERGTPVFYRCLTSSAFLIVWPREKNKVVTHVDCAGTKLSTLVVVWLFSWPSDCLGEAREGAGKDMI